MNKFSEQLRYLRTKNNLTCSQLAEILKVNPSTIYRWETKRNDIFSNDLAKIAKLFNVTIDFLLGLEKTSTK